MKKMLGIILVLVFFSSFLFGCAGIHKRPTYTYESEINLAEFRNWDVFQQTNPLYDFCNRTFAILRNPDLQAPISYVLTQAIDKHLIGYAYYKGNELFVYIYEESPSRYERMKPSKRQRREIQQWLGPYLFR